MKDKIVGIYKVVSPTGKVYIGQTVNFKERKRTYVGVKCTGQRRLYNSLVKYGGKNHVIELIHELPKDVSKETMNIYEVLYWEEYRNCGVEMLNIREPGSSGRISEETKLLFKNRTPWNKGKLLTEEHRRNCSISLKGIRKSEETKRKMSALKKGSRGPVKGILQCNLNGEVIKEWESVTLASKSLSIPRTTISDCLNQRSKSTRGFKWRYK